MKQHLCSGCQKRIGKYGESCLEFMEELCCNILHGKVFCYHEEYSEKYVKHIVKYLENKRLVVSCEVRDELVCIRPNMHTAEFDPETEQFCWCNLY